MKKDKNQPDFTHRLLNLISEPHFVKFENILSEPNFFKIVGRTHYERWHSSFWGWLLDANGSHLLLDYNLKRFLMLLLDDKCLKASNYSDQSFLNLLPILEFSEIEVTPNEHFSTEVNVSGVGRFDIYLSTTFTDDLNGVKGRLNIIFELKIDSKPIKNQANKYANWLLENHPNDINFLILLTPNLLNSSKSTLGDERWYCLDYQLLNDKLLIPLLDHPNLNAKVKPFIIQYVKNLKIRYRGIKMAITNEEKKLALALYEKYSDIFDSIYDALVENNTIDYSTSEVSSSKGRILGGRLAVKIANKVFSNETVRLLYDDVLKYLVEQNHFKKLPLPWGVSQARYVVTDENPAKHPNGRDFFYPVQFSEYTMESHYSRERGMKILGSLCQKLDLAFEIIDS